MNAGTHNFDTSFPKLSDLASKVRNIEWENNEQSRSKSASNTTEPVDVLQTSTSGSLSPTSLATKIRDIEKQMLDGKLVFVDEDGKPLQPKIVSTS